MTIQARCKRIKLFLSDVDGVLTDGGMYYAESGEESKLFSTLDGGGFLLLRQLNILTGILTSERTQLVERRGRKLGLDFVRQGAKNKSEALDELLREAGCTVDEVAYIGDDINDIAILRRVGVSATVPGNFLPDSLQCDYVTQRPGGLGAVRDFAEWLLQQRGEYEKALKAYLDGIG